MIERFDPREFYMTTHWETQEGILLQSTPYLESRRIVKIFTKNNGLLSLIGNSKKLSLTTPFCKAEWIYKQTPGDLFSLKEASLLNPYMNLRESYEKLKSAGSIANDLLRSQLAYKESSKLYSLLSACFEHLSYNPTAIAQSFRLKLLRLDGLLHLQPFCMECEKEALDLTEGQSTCSNHAAQGKRAGFTQTEWQQVLSLGLAKRFSDLKELLLSQELLKKLDSLFKERIF